MITVANSQSAQERSFFTIKILARSDTPDKHVANYVAQELQKISIDYTLYSYPEGAFESALVSRDFDIVISEFEWSSKDVDPSVYFTEFGSGNYWGIDGDINGSEENGLYLKEGLSEPDLIDRIAIYHDWQEHIMTNILPIIPLYNTKTTYSTWGTLTGWDHGDGLIASLPYMDWSSTHYGQLNDSAFVDYIDFWEQLNPLFVDDDFVASLVSEPLIRLDGNNEPVGVLAESWSYNENFTELTINLKKNVKWQPDIDNIYTTEIFDSEDVIFSILMYQEVSTTGTYFEWIDDIEEVNKSTIILHIDGDATTPGAQPFAPALNSLDKLLLPEHYLNVSVGDNGLPDTSSSQWTKYGVNGLGTGMYRFVPGKFEEDVEAIFYSNLDWWGSTPEGLDEDLDIQEYKFRFFYDQNTRQLEYEKGEVDVFKDYRDTYDDYLVAPYQYQTRSDFDVTYIGFNMNSENTPEIWDPTLTEDGTMSKGLAVRKAIAHLIDKTILDAMLDIEIQVIETPLSNAFGQIHNRSHT